MADSTENETSLSKTDIASTSSSSTTTTELNPEQCSSTSTTTPTKNDNSGDADTEQIDKELLKKEALMAMQNGKRHMIVQDYASAVPCFETACEFLGKCYGVRALECAEPYLYYGISLYELSRIHGDNVVIEKEEDVADEEDEEESEEENDEYISVTNVIVGSNQNPKTEKDSTDQPSTSKDVATPSTSKDEAGPSTSKNEVGPSTSKDEVGPSTSKVEAGPSTSKVEAGPSTSKDDSAAPTTSVSSSSTPMNETNGVEENDEEKASNIEIACECLLTAREIYSEHLTDEDKEMHLNYAETLQKLGEINIDWGNADAAIDFLNQCLEQRESMLDKDDRLIAVTYHLLGLAFSAKYDVKMATNFLNKSVEIIEMRINNLKAMDKKTMNQFEIESNEREIQQMESLIPEINLKIEDVKEQIRIHDQSLLDLENQTKEVLKAVKPINSINHLIKRKRSDNDNEPEKETNKAIKIVQSSTPSTSATTTSATIDASSSSSNNNGVSPTEENNLKH